MIITHGNDDSVSSFAKREKIKYLEEFFSYDFAKLVNYDRYIKYIQFYLFDRKIEIVKENEIFTKSNNIFIVRKMSASYQEMASKHVLEYENDLYGIFS